MSNCRVLCIIPAHPDESCAKTLESVRNQTYPVAHIELLTEVIKEKMPFPAKLSRVINNYLTSIDLSQYDVLMRVDADTILPPNFVEENLKSDYKALGFGYAQLIDIPTFIRLMDGKMHPAHDDGYVLAKFHYSGYKTSNSDYAVKPILNRAPGRHHGSRWFIEQGELNYMYGDDPFNMSLNLLYNFHEYDIYLIFYVYGFYKGLILKRTRFDIAPVVMYRNMLKFRNPIRLFRVFIYMKKRMARV